MMIPSPIELVSAFDALTEYWSPRVIARVNDQYVKVAKLKGVLAWHEHEAEDELSLVVRGQLTIQFEEGDVQLTEGQLAVVPRGKRHNPTCLEECWVVLIETITTKHTGDVVTPLTRSIAEQLS